MPATYEKIATTTLGSSQSSITFNSIPNTYTDLKLIFTQIGTTTDTSARLIFNSDNNTNYSQTSIRGDGSNAASSRVTDRTYIFVMFWSGLSNSTQPLFWDFNVFSYANSTNKTILFTSSQDTNGAGVVARDVALWRNTSAITSLTLTSNNNFASGTTATLYGILKA